MLAIIPPIATNVVDLAAVRVRRQAELQDFVERGRRLLYGRRPRLEWLEWIKWLVQSLDGNGDPLSGLGNTLGAAVAHLAAHARRNRARIPPKVMADGASELLRDLADFSAQSGGHVYTGEELRLIAQHINDFPRRTYGK